MVADNSGEGYKRYILLTLQHTLTPRREGGEGESPSGEPPITKLWLAAINSFGEDIYVFKLQKQRQHWLISRLDGASVAAVGFHPRDNNVLVISTSSNQVFALDVEARQLGKWSLLQTFLSAIEIPRIFIKERVKE